MLNIAILGYSSDLVGFWDPSTTINGLPGSEECVVYASEELVSRGHKVTIYMNPPPNSLFSKESCNPKWLPVNTWVNTNNKDTYDLVLMWRRFDCQSGRERGKVVFCWPHDSPHYNNVYPNFPNFDGVLPLSKHHRQQLSIYPNFTNIPYTICGNGIVPQHFSQSNKSRKPLSLGYFSNYARGLIHLLDIWPDIIKEFPEATLSICYGRETWNTTSKENLNWIIAKIEEYKDIGVIEHGKVGHLELADIMKSTSIWAYPCNTNTETYCITAVKCQAAGCIPVTTRIGALDETVHQDAPSIPVIDIIKYKELLLSTMKRVKESNQEDIKQERLKYINFASTHTWSACIDKWIDLYNRVK